MPGDNAGGENTDRYFLFQVLTLFLVAFLLYANSINNGFNLDDELYTVNAKAMAGRGLQSIPQIFTSHTFTDADNNYEYRPVALLSFVLQYIFISPSAQASHLVNVVLYAFTCVLLFILLRKWFTKKYSWFAFLACLVFTVHPLHTEIVDNIKNRDELLEFFFSLSALIAIWKMYETRRWVYGLLYVVLFMLAMCSKKTATPFVVLIPIAFYFFSKLSLKKILQYSSLILVPRLIIFVFGRHFAVPSHRITFEHENPFYKVNSDVLIKLATSINVAGRYLYLHIFPSRLVYYYGYKYVPVVGWDNVYVWVSLLLHLAFVCFLAMNIRKRSILVFGGVLYIISIIVYSNIVRPAPGMMAERFMYLPSLGFSILLCAAIAWLFKTDLSLIGNNKVLTTLILLVCFGFAARSFVRNRDWKDKHTLYTHDMKYLDSSAKANSMYAELLTTEAHKYKTQACQGFSPSSGLAKAYRDSAANLLAEAKDRYKTALRITPDFPNALNNIGIILIEQDSIALAKDYFQRSLVSTTQKARVYHDLAMIYMREGLYDSSVLFFNRSINADSSFLDAYCNLSKLQVDQHDTLRAEHTLLLAAVKNKQSSIPYIQLADIALFKRDTMSIVRYCEMAAELRPANVPILSFLVTYYKGKKDQAKADYYNNKISAIQASEE